MATNEKKLPELKEGELRVLELLTDGYGKQEIAGKLGIDLRSVDRRLEDGIKKLSELEPRLLPQQKETTKKEDHIGTVGRIATVIKIFRQYYLKDISNEQKVNAVRRREIHYVMNIKEDHIDIETDVQIECLFDELEYIAHGLVLDDRSPQADGSHQSLNVLSKTEGLHVTWERLINDAKKTRFLVHFDPPLKKHDIVKYHYSIRSANYFPMSMKEIHKRMNEGFYHLLEPIAETNFTISTYTDLLTLELRFPDLFEIVNPHIVVEVGHNGARVPEEEKRIEDSIALKLLPYRNKKTLEFRLKQPLFNHRYRIRWQPRK